MAAEEQGLPPAPALTAETRRELEKEARRSGRVLAVLTLVLGALGVILGLFGGSSATTARPHLFNLFVTGALACFLGGWIFRQRLPALLVMASIVGMQALISVLVVIALMAAGEVRIGLALGIAYLLVGGLYGVGLARAAMSEGQGTRIWRIVLLLGSMLLLMVLLGVVVALALPGSLGLILYGSVVITAGVTAWAARLLPVESLGLGRPSKWIHAAWPPAAAIVLAWAAMRYLNILVSWLGPGFLHSQMSMEAISRPERLVLFVLMVPVAEEILFRGIFQSTMKSMWGAPTAILTTSLLFGIAHASPATLPVLFLAGLTAGLARELSGSLIPCILFHMIYNGWLLL